MGLAKLSVGLVRCPTCRQGLLSEQAERAICGRCQAAFPAAKGVVDLLPPTLQNPGYLQRAMEWPWLVGIYESRWWRRSPFHASAFGCTFEEEQALILRSLSLGPGARVLDLACGPGIYTRPLARAASGGIALGLDISWPMLSHASARARGESLENIVWIRASALELPMPDAALDGVSCCAALHLFPDVPRVLSEVRRVLKPGGRFAVGMARRADGLLGRLEMMASKGSGLTARSSQELGSLLQGAGFADIQIHHSKRAWLIASAARQG